MYLQLLSMAQRWFGMVDLYRAIADSTSEKNEFIFFKLFVCEAAEDVSGALRVIGSRCYCCKRTARRQSL